MPKMSVRKNCLQPQKQQQQQQQQQNKQQQEKEKDEQHQRPHQHHQQQELQPQQQKKHSNIRTSITRKKLFQFLYKNYLKSAYCGITKVQQQHQRHQHLHHHQKHKHQLHTTSSESEDSGGCGGGGCRPNLATNRLVEVGGGAGVSTAVVGGSGGDIVQVTTEIIGNNINNKNNKKKNESFSSSSSTSTTAVCRVKRINRNSRNSFNNNCSGGGGGIAGSSKKREFRSEYFNDMSECYKENLQRKRSSVMSFRNDFAKRKLSQRTSCGNLDMGLKDRQKIMTVTKQMDNKFEQNDDIGWGKQTMVKLERAPHTSFGVCIVGGKVNISKDAQVSGIFIKNIIPGSPADVCKQIKIGDRILSVNEQDVRDSSQDKAINLIKNAGCCINLVLQSFDANGNDIENSSKPSSYATTPPQPPPVSSSSSQKSSTGLEIKKGSNDNVSSSSLPSSAAAQPSGSAANTTGASLQVQDEHTSGNKQASSSFGSNDDESSDDDEDEEETSGKIVTKAGYEIDRKSAGNVKRTKEEIDADEEKENNYGYTDKKLKKKYGFLGGTVIRAYIQRDNNNNMGLALAGHRDRNKMGTFVAGINPKGSAASQNVQVGDEILEINGVHLHKLCHLNASVIIKGIVGVTMEYILLRLPNGIDDIAVKPVLSFPSAFDQFDQLYSCFKNVRSVTIQKVGTSLGIMIIEGKHSDVGQGIFISDIQENSNAENAGVKIGEMILAVNKDLLIDTNYDTAAGLLKRAEGIVTLTLCNPNKKEDAAEGGKGGTIEEPKKETAAKTPEPIKEPEVPKDPATTPIAINKETIIELNAENKPLGIIVVKGDDSQVQQGATIILIHSNGAVNKDGRLQVFDKVLEIDGKKISSETSETDLKTSFKHLYSRVKMVIYRAEPVDIKEMDVDVTKKSGKDIGMGYAECKDNGIFVTEIIPGGIIDMDHRIIKGDIITHINGEDIRKSNFIECTLLMKAAQPKMVFKIIRPKGKK